MEKKELTELVAKKTLLQAEIAAFHKDLEEIDSTAQSLTPNMANTNSTMGVKAMVDVPVWQKRPGQSDQESVMQYCREMRIYLRGLT